MHRHGVKLNAANIASCTTTLNRWRDAEQEYIVPASSRAPAGEQALLAVEPPGVGSQDQELEERLADMEARMAERLDELVHRHEDQVTS